jgi:hypothetical protein
LRLGGAGIAKNIQDNGSTTTAKVSANSSFVGTYDYYIHKSGSSFASYIGADIGYYFLANVVVFLCPKIALLCLYELENGYQKLSVLFED